MEFETVYAQQQLLILKHGGRSVCVRTRAGGARWSRLRHSDDLIGQRYGWQALIGPYITDAQSLRMQVTDTSVELIELVPPVARTNLRPGHEESEFSIPLEDFIDQSHEPAR